MNTLSISARPRARHGRHLGPLRREGVIPAVVYGHGQQPQSIEADVRTVERLWIRAGRSTLVDLELEGGATRKVLIREIQFNKRTGVPIHVDFFAPNLKVVTVADVPIMLVGESPAVALKLGQIQAGSSSLKVEALPVDLPTQVVVDLAVLVAIDSVVTAGDITLPHGVTLVSDPGEVVVKLDARRGRGGADDEDGDEGEAEAEESSATTEAAEDHAEA